MTGGLIMEFTHTDGLLTLFLPEQIDSTNASSLEREIMGIVSSADPAKTVLDATDLEYITSAGIRVILRLAMNTNENLVCVNASTEVYEILRLTGMASLMEVSTRIR